jgi:tetratricopeptide (TPR) repeat protein
MAQVTLREYLQETEDAISAERVDDALTHCQTILAQFPESLEAQRLIGEVYLALERLSDAQQNFDWVLTNDPENVVAYCDRALISEHMSDYDTALDCYQQAYELSRGNSHIRQEFNQLSAKAGQQGFMLSRAGLARLYMRGDLLTQAMQEWEAVLAVSPERLDARTGLLETYWREGLYDRVEQLASQILQDVPGCLKALLLLAYVTAAKNMQKAQELLQRAEVLDPDHTMAQELFSDALASQPAEPFLQLLRKPPTLVETSLSSSPATAYALPRQEEALAQYATHASTATGANWNGAEWPSGPTWDSDTLVGASSGAQPERNAAPIDDVWSALERQPEMPQPVAEVQHADTWSMYGQPMQDDGQPQNTWQQELQSAPSNEQKQAEPIAWDSGAFDRYKEPSLGGLDSWEALKGNGSADVASAWSSSSKEEAAPAPPAWLNMLTQSEGKQASGPLPTGTAQPPSTPVQPLPTPVQPPVQPAASVQPVSIEKPVQKAEPIAAVPESLDDEPFSFGPEWLKSLGAASIDMAFPVESSPVAEKAPAPEPVAYEPPPEAPRQEVREPRDEPPVVQTPESTEDQRLLRTLEKLESDLRLQGFVPLQPNSLSSLSQNPEPGADGALPEHGADVQEVPQRPREAYRGEAALSSALAELGNYIHQSSSLLNTSPAQDVTTEPAQPAPESTMPSVPAEEPSWLAALGRDAAFSPAEEPSWITSLNSVPSPSASTDQITQDETMANLFSSPDQPFWAGLDVPQKQPTQEQPTQEQPLQESVAEEITESAAPAWSWNDALQGSSEEQLAQDGASEDVVASPIWPVSIASNEPLQEAPAAQSPAPFVSATTPSGQLPPVPAPSVQMNGGQEARQSPAARSEALFDSELEATMKRPAVRLQPMQQRSASQKDIMPPSGGRMRATERASGGNAVGTMSYQERLSKGYQHQLFGDYDEAMQEYRIVIRNAPELLTDIVSNVRALLKLAPKYATGYRVLGDAYMRQGEYLQAMEAYNKALTMAKRAKN